MFRNVYIALHRVEWYWNCRQKTCAVWRKGQLKSVMFEQCSLLTEERHHYIFLMLCTGKFCFSMCNPYNINTSRTEHSSLFHC